MATIDDHAVTAVAELSRSGQIPTYAWLKDRFGRSQISEDTYRSLNRGRAIIKTVDQLDQYLYSYAPMVASQWEYASRALVGKPSNAGERLIDYGCGRGLAGLLLHDHLGPQFIVDVSDVIVIEPSDVALQRAVSIYQALVPKATVVPINKAFNGLCKNDLAVGRGDTTHIFSNVLDIDGYDHVDLLRKGLAPGNHTIVAVGHDRIAHGYSQGLERVRAAVEAGTVRQKTMVHANELETFKCRNRGEPAVMWFCKLEVSDG